MPPQDLEPMLVTRYLMKNLLSAMVFVAVVLAMVVLLTQSLKILELVANADASPGMYLKLVSLTLPKFLETILPVSLVTAVLFTYNRFIMDNELIVLRSCGFDQHALARPAITLAAVTTLVMLLLTTWLTPICYGEMKSLRLTVMARYSALLLREGVFNTFGKDLTVYIRTRGQDGDLTGIVIHDTRDKKKPPVTTTAKRGKLVMSGDIPNIIVEDGMRQQLDTSSNTVSRLYFSSYKIEINSLDSGPRARARDYSERTLPELLRPDMNSKYDRDNREVFLAEAHADLSRPFTSVSYTMVALAIILIGPFNRRGQTRKVFLAALVVVLLLSAGLALGNLTRKHLEFAPLLYIVTFVPVFAGFYALNLTGEQQIMSLIRKIQSRLNRREKVVA